MSLNGCAYEAGTTVYDRCDRLKATIAGQFKKLDAQRAEAIAAALPALLKALKRDGEQPEAGLQALEARSDRYLLARGKNVPSLRPSGMPT